MAQTRIHYSEDYNLDLLGLEKAHPFDMRKAGRALDRLRSAVGSEAVDAALVRVTKEADRALLCLGHASEYLDTLVSPVLLQHALGVPGLAQLPIDFLDCRILRPMRIGVQGTVDAMRSALTAGVAVNLAGGFHHASHDRGEGFCVYGDAVIALRSLMQDGDIAQDAPVLYVDLDAHQGNGFARLCQFYELDRVIIFDMYNRDIYPGDADAAKRIDIGLPLPTDTKDAAYLAALRDALPGAFTDNLALVIYNAGTDILAGDPLGCLSVSSAGVLARDILVIDACRKAGVPLLILPSGGYTEHSHELIAGMLEYLLCGGGL